MFSYANVGITSQQSNEPARPRTGDRTHGWSARRVDSTLYLVGLAPLTVEGQLLIVLDPDDVETWFLQERIDQRLLSSDTSPMGINICHGATPFRCHGSSIGPETKSGSETLHRNYSRL